MNDPADVVGVDVVVDGPLGKFVPLVGRSGKTLKYFNLEKKVNLKVFYTVTTLYKYYIVEKSVYKTFLLISISNCLAQI